MAAGSKRGQERNDFGETGEQERERGQSPWVQKYLELADSLIRRFKYRSEGATGAHSKAVGTPKQPDGP